MRGARDARDARGFALVAVLWILVAVGAASVSLHASARASRLGSINAGAEARARWAAREGLARAIDAVERFAVARGDWEAAGLGRTVRLAALPGGDGVVIDVLVLDARARLDLNHATPTELQGLLAAALGRDDPRVPVLRDRILDWRDTDGRRRRLGAEAPDYRRVDAPARVADGPFRSVEELAEVAGMDDRLVRVLSPLVTVDGDGLVNANAAPGPVLAAVLGLDRQTARLLLDRRSVRPFTSVFDIVEALPAGLARELESRIPLLRERLAFAPRDLEVHVSASARGSATSAHVVASIRLVRAGVWELRRILES